MPVKKNGARSPVSEKEKWRKKGDKSKNEKAVTLVVMYTLEKTHDEDGKPLLLGPIDKRYYAS